MKNPLIDPSRQYPFDGLSKTPIFCQESSFAKCPSVNFQRNRLFSGAGVAEMGRLHSRKRFDCLKMGSGLRSFNVRKIDYFSSTRGICCGANSSLSGRRSRDGRRRVDAQNALFDYLHCTRSLSYADAEHMSKYSPVFLEKLLAKVENDQDVGRSVTKILRFHTINEYEPFFESLGLESSELHSLLPREFFYLTDDKVLIENYNVLCGFGVPRSKIGKMYKEATEIFRYDYGVLLSKLQAYEELGLGRPTIIKLIICCPSFLVGGVNAEFFRVLERLKALDVELESIRGCFLENSVYKWGQIFEMLNFLESMGCDKKDLTNLIREHPRFVFDDSGKKIYVLVATLLKLGLKMEKILELFARYPRILVGNFVKNLWTSINFLYEIGIESKEIARIVSTHTQVLGSFTCKKVKSVLKNLNLTAERLCEIIKKDPGQLSKMVAKGNITLEDTPKVEGIFLQEKTDFLLKLGFVENSDEIAIALRKFRGRGDQLQERFDFLVNSGLDYHVAAEMVKSVPNVLNQSTDVVKKKIDHLVYHLRFPVESLATFPSYLCYSMDKIKLRFTMYKWIKEHGVTMPISSRKTVKSTVSLSSILACADARFEKYYVSLHPEGPGVWKTLQKQYIQDKEN